jgi:hypothetical protein
MKTSRPAEPEWVQHATPFQRFMYRTPAWRIVLYGYLTGFTISLGSTLMYEWLR